MHRVWQVKIEQKYYPGRGHVSTNSQYHRLVPWEADLEMEISVQEFFFFSGMPWDRSTAVEGRERNQDSTEGETEL